MDDQVRRKVASENAQRRFGDRIPSCKSRDVVYEVVV